MDAGIERVKARYSGGSEFQFLEGIEINELENKIGRLESNLVVKV